MQAPAGNLRVLHFGVFEVDLQEAELRKSGIRIKLQEQPFQILSILLEHSGQTVSREELRRRLWPADTFVDFDHSLNSSIKKLREALGDDSDAPRFIETLHRRGYRFVASVNGPPAANAQLELGSPAAAAPDRSERLGTRQKWAGIATLVLAATLLFVWLRSPLPPPRVVASQELTNDGFPKSSAVGEIYRPDTLVTDGNRIYFIEYPPARDTIAQVSTRGGETSTVEMPIPYPHVVAISSDQSELLVRQWVGGDSYWSMPLPAGPPRRLGDVSGDCAVWGPDGKLVFGKESNLYIAEHDGSNPRKFATVPGDTENCSFSPDGTQLRFTVMNQPNHTSAIWETHLDGSDMHPLIPDWNNPPAECCGHWTPDGKYYVFQSTRAGTTSIWILPEHSPWWRKSSREPVQLTVGPLQLSAPLPSTDGKRLFAIGTHRRAELVRYDLKSGEFVPYMGGISATDVDFSRDGQWVTYVRNPERTLWRSKLDGSARLQLTWPPVRAVVPHWSPDGQQIAFSGRVPGKPWKVFLISRDGGSLQPITADELEELDPAWSVDGKELAFAHSSLGNDASSRIGLLNLETRQISELPGSQKICCPRWSPDGRYIIAISVIGYDELMLYDFKTEKWRKVNINAKPIGFGYLAWSRDSAYAYLDMETDSGKGYFRLRISDLKLERLVDLKALRQFPDLFAPGESWSGLGPRDTPLFVRDNSTQEIYALDLELP